MEGVGAVHITSSDRRLCIVFPVHDLVHHLVGSGACHDLVHLTWWGAGPATTWSTTPGGERGLPRFLVTAPGGERGLPRFLVTAGELVRPHTRDVSVAVASHAEADVVVHGQVDVAATLQRGVGGGVCGRCGGGVEGSGDLPMKWTG